MQALLEEYRGYLKTLALSENTLSSYIHDVEAFTAFISAKSGREILKVNKNRIDEYVDELKSSNRANSTISRNVAALRKFYRYLQKEGKIKTNPVMGIEIPHIEKKLPEALTAREVVKLLNQPQCKDLKGYRDKAMLELMYATGIKVSEIISLSVRDVDIHGGMISCNSEKHQRYIPIGRAARDAVGEYIKKARPLLVRGENVKNLFVNCMGEPLTRQGFWKILRGYALSAGIKTEINAQTIRNSFAVHLLQNGADISAVSEMLGHGDVVTTRIYDKVLKNNIKKIYKKAHPRA